MANTSVPICTTILIDVSACNFCCFCMDKSNSFGLLLHKSVAELKLLWNSKCKLERRELETKMTVEAYGQAYQRGFDRTIRLLLSRGARIDCAREAAQAAWAKGWERIDQLRNESVVTTWVNTIALNCYRGVMRSENHQLPLTELATTASVNLAVIDLDRYLARCRPSDRKLFDDYLEGYPLEEIAVRQGISYTATRIRLLRARRAVQSQIKERESLVRINRSRLIAECQAAA